MARCGSCGADTRRLKTVFEIGGRKLERPRDACPQCAPGEFDGWVDPSNKHGGFAWQYEPEKYVKRYMEDGSVFYEATDEQNADLEAKVTAGSAEAQAGYERAVEKKRRERRLTPLTAAERDSAIRRFKNRSCAAEDHVGW